MKGLAYGQVDEEAVSQNGRMSATAVDTVTNYENRVARVRHLIERQSLASRPDDAANLIRRVCVAAARALSAAGAGMSIVTAAGVRSVSAASDPASERLENLQFVLGEGPCIDAYADRRPVLIADLDKDAGRRWPAYTPAAYEVGLRAVFAFPLQVGAVRLGVLDIYRQQKGALSDDDLRQAVTFAEVAVAALLDRHDTATSAGTADGVDTAIGNRATLFQAQGMVMVQIGVTIDEAMSVLRAYAYAEDRRLDAVAQDVVSRRLVFDQERP